MSEFYGKMSGNGGRTHVTRAGHKTDGIYAEVTDKAGNDAFVQFKHDRYGDTTEVFLRVNGVEILEGDISKRLSKISPYLNQETEFLKDEIKRLQKRQMPSPVEAYNDMIYFIKIEAAKALKSEMGDLGSIASEGVNRRIVDYIYEKLNHKDFVEKLTNIEEPSEETKEEVEKDGLAALFG